MSEDNKWICKDGNLHHGELIESSNNFDIIECFECGFKHVTPIPTNDELEEIYSHDYYTTEKPFYIEHYLEDKEWWDIVYTDRYEIFEKNLPANSRKLLDVGSGPGLFLNLGKDRGWRVKGIEPSTQAAAYSKDVLKLDVEEVEAELHFVQQKSPKARAFSPPPRAPAPSPEEMNSSSSPEENNSSGR